MGRPKVEEHAPQVRLDGKQTPVMRADGKRRRMLYVGDTLVAESNGPGAANALSHWAFDKHGANFLKFDYDLGWDE